jgi:two-component system phosphate regulon response regulator PhoB
VRLDAARRGGYQVGVPTVLLVDDERDLLSVLDFNFRSDGFETTLASSGDEALRLATQRVPDLVLLDLMLPDIPGTEVCRRLKADPRTQDVPVIMLTARGDEIDRIVGFEVGADDYVTKPFSPREVLLRARAVLRRAGGKPAERAVSQVGPIRVDTEAHRVYVDGAEVALTPLEFRLLWTLMTRLGRVQPRERLLQDVWEMSTEVETRTVDTHMKRLREKLGAGRDLIETVRGIGYRMTDPAAKE